MIPNEYAVSYVPLVWSDGLFLKDDISKKNSTEHRRGLILEGLRPVTPGRMYRPDLDRALLNPQGSDHFPRTP